MSLVEIITSLSDHNYKSDERVHSNLRILQKLNSLDRQEAGTEWEQWAVSDSDNDSSSVVTNMRI